jgi:hypothetical protein
VPPSFDVYVVLSRFVDRYVDVQDPGGPRFDAVGAVLRAPRLVLNGTCTRRDPISGRPTWAPWLYRWSIGRAGPGHFVGALPASVWWLVVATGGLTPASGPVRKVLSVLCGCLFKGDFRSETTPEEEL